MGWALALPTSAHAASAAIDTTFGTQGETAVSLNGGWAPFTGDAFRLLDDRFVVAGVEQGYGLAIARFTASGAPDPTFDGDGIATLPLGSTANVDVSGVVVDGDGTSYVAFTDGAGSTGIARWSSTGSFVAPPLSVPGTSDVLGGVRLTPDGASLVVPGADGDDLVVRRLDKGTGAADTTFGGGDGEVRVALGGAVRPQDVSVRSDGTTFVTGSVVDPAVSGGEPTLFVARIAPDGSGTPLVVRPLVGRPEAHSEGYEVNARDDGLTYVAGGAAAGTQRVVLRLGATLGRDPGFDGDGVLLDPVPAGSFGSWDAVNVQTDGAVVLAGGQGGPGGQTAISRRVSATGTTETTFGDGGSFTRQGAFSAVAMVGQTGGAGRYVQVAHEDAGDGTPRLLLTGLKPVVGATTPPPTTQPEPQPDPPFVPQPPRQFQAAAAAPGCTTKLTLGPLQVRAGCLKREGLVWRSSSTVSLGGLKIVPNGGSAEVVIDPLNLRLAVKGSAKVQLEGRLGGRTLGPVTVWQGRFDWLLQARPELAGLAGVVLPTGKAQTVSLPKLAGLPGLAGVASLPRLPDLGLPDFSKVKAADVDKLVKTFPSLKTGDVKLSMPTIGINFLPALRFELPSAAGSIFGLKVAGDISLRPSERSGPGVEVETNLELPLPVGNVTGRTKFFAGFDGAVEVDRLGLDSDYVSLGLFAYAQPLRLAYDATTDTFTGATTVYPGFDPNTGLGGSWVVRGGRVERIGVVVENVPLGSTVNLAGLAVDVTFEPFRVRGFANLTAGPTVPFVNQPALQLLGDFDFDGESAGLRGQLKLAGIDLAEASARYWWNGTFKAEGRVSYFIDAARQYGFEGTIAGDASKLGFNAEGSVTFRAKSKSVSGKGLVSSKGVAGCTTLKGVLWRDVELGAGYVWGASRIDWLGGNCSFAKYRAKISARAAQAGGPQAVTVGAGQDAISWKVAGDGAPPRFTLTGPGGATVTTPADGETVLDDRFVVVQQPADGTTYVAVARPAAGTWTFTPQPGSSIRSIASAATLPDVDVRGTVRGGRLAYRVKPIPGQKVTFLERGRGMRGELGVAKGRAGSLLLQPAGGPSGRRTIEAVVEQDGMVRKVVRVAAYTVADRPLAAPRVVLRRTKAGVATVHWTPVPGAKGYVVALRAGGRVEGRRTPASGRTARFDGLLPSAGLRVTVRALGGPKRIGRPGTATAAKAKVRKRTGKVPARRTTKRR